MVLYSASCTLAPEMATLFAGRVTPACSGAQVFMTVVTRSLPNAPTSTASAASGGSSGGPHPGSCTSGSENCAPTWAASCAGHAALCPAAKMPADCTPMLLLVPRATYRWKTSAAVGGKSSRDGAGMPGARRGESGSVQAVNANAAPMSAREYFMCALLLLCAPTATGPRLRHHLATRAVPTIGPQPFPRAAGAQGDP